eukprot:1685765-Rhodomonas_salina.1
MTIPDSTDVVFTGCTVEIKLKAPVSSCDPRALLVPVGRWVTGSRPPIVLCVRYAMSGTEIGYVVRARSGDGARQEE